MVLVRGQGCFIDMITISFYFEMANLTAHDNESINSTESGYFSFIQRYNADRVKVRSCRITVAGLFSAAVVDPPTPAQTPAPPPSGTMPSSLMRLDPASSSFRSQLPGLGEAGSATSNTREIATPGRL